MSSKFTFLDCFTEDFSSFAFFPVPKSGNEGWPGLILWMRLDEIIFYEGKAGRKKLVVDLIYDIRMHHADNLIKWRLTETTDMQPRD